MWIQRSTPVSWTWAVCQRRMALALHRWAHIRREEYALSSVDRAPAVFWCARRPGRCSVCTAREDESRWARDTMSTHSNFPTTTVFARHRCTSGTLLGRGLARLHFVRILGRERDKHSMMGSGEKTSWITDMLYTPSCVPEPIGKPNNSLKRPKGFQEGRSDPEGCNTWAISATQIHQTTPSALKQGADWTSRKTIVCGLPAMLMQTRALSG